MDEQFKIISLNTVPSKKDLQPIRFGPSLPVTLSYATASVYYGQTGGIGGGNRKLYVQTPLLPLPKLKWDIRPQVFIDKKKSGGVGGGNDYSEEKEEEVVNKGGGGKGFKKKTGKVTASAIVQLYPEDTFYKALEPLIERLISCFKETTDERLGVNPKVILHRDQNNLSDGITDKVVKGEFTYTETTFKANVPIQKTGKTNANGEQQYKIAVEVWLFSSYDPVQKKFTKRLDTEDKPVLSIPRDTPVTWIMYPIPYIFGKQRGIKWEVRKLVVDIVTDPEGYECEIPGFNPTPESISSSSSPPLPPQQRQTSLKRKHQQQEDIEHQDQPNYVDENENLIVGIGGSTSSSSTSETIEMQYPHSAENVATYQASMQQTTENKEKPTVTTILLANNNNKKLKK